jgi:esterase/lipase
MSEGVIRRDEDHFVINRAKMEQEHAFHTIRLENMMQVIANEIEPVQPAVEAVRRYVNLSTAQLKKRTSVALREREAAMFDRDYTDAFDPTQSRAKEQGEPFFLEKKGAAAGVVLTHGYLASPEQVRPLAEYLHEQGHSVYVVRLPGHGTAPEQMTRVHWKDWLDAVSRGLALVRQHCQTVVVGGFSMGGTLSLLLAARQAEAVHGVFGINAPGKLRDRRASLVGPIVRWNAWMRGLRLSGNHYSMSNDGTESPDINYRVDYLRGIRELRRAMKACHRSLGDVKAPAMLLQGNHDPLVDPDGGRMLLKRLGCDDKILSTMSFDRHMILRGDGSEDVFNAVGRFVTRIAEKRSLAAAKAKG